MQREDLVRFLRRRRRIRLMAVSAGVALVCGIAAAYVAPKVGVGGVRGMGRPSPALDSSRGSAEEARGISRAELSQRISLDLREIRINSMRWAVLSEAERRAFLERYWRLAELDPADQDRLIQRYAAFRRLPEERQVWLRERAKRLGDFVSQLSPPDQAALASLGERERAERLLELWRCYLQRQPNDPSGVPFADRPFARVHP